MAIIFGITMLVHGFEIGKVKSHSFISEWCTTYCLKLHSNSVNSVYLSRHVPVTFISNIGMAMIVVYSNNKYCQHQFTCLCFFTRFWHRNEDLSCMMNKSCLAELFFICHDSWPYWLETVFPVVSYNLFCMELLILHLAELDCRLFGLWRNTGGDSFFKGARWTVRELHRYMFLSGANREGCLHPRMAQNLRAELRRWVSIIYWLTSLLTSWHD